MSNEFVDYLNSMNSADGHSANSLAESQIKSDFYKEIKVKRKLVEYIKGSILNGENKSFIITGHAGDGKTSILAQILIELGFLENREFKEYDDITNDGKRIFYVKDMSELTQENQELFIKKALDLSKKEATSIVISNTGPLLKTVKKIDPKKESEIIEQLDINSEEEIEIAGKYVTIINLARIENVNFVDGILDNIIKENLWHDCKKCGKQEYCHISNNIKLIEDHKERFKLFLKAFYRFLSENDKRLTIRQMMAHISFAITANKKCDEIREIANSKLYYKHLYNVSNNLFGYLGMQDNKSANQIRAIELIKELNLDNKALDVDYDLFIKNDFGIFPKDIKEIIGAKWKNFEIEIRNSIENEEKIEKSILIRKCIRRYYLIFGHYNELIKVEDAINEVFGEKFTVYNQCILSNESRRNIKDIYKIIFNALIKINTGTDQKIKELYITLGKQNSRSNVRVIIGEIGRSDLEVRTENKVTAFDDVAVRNELYLYQKKSKYKFKISYQLLDYFYSINMGAIDTKASPRITCGIDKLNSWLLKEFKFDDEEQLRLLIKSSEGCLIETIEIDKERMTLDVTEG